MAAKLNKRILVDFDGVIMQRGKGKNAQPIEGSIAALKAMRKLGYEVIVFTTRAAEGGSGSEHVRQWLDEHGAEYDGISGQKLDARHYIDDKAIAFRDNWGEIVTKVG